MCAERCHPDLPIHESGQNERNKSVWVKYQELFIGDK